ncbi:HBL287Wp [Eremothecium sinecaudum]|uniref:tRNA:m(4)X modification enzyme TRM13 n=1 Tax=Eremothecium sinecaudum TaxID=45286 RepID=A0A120K0R7_9SACH|nr:HBL287Wp [Eremothecium sinecaudum]AMD18615.1 HBL287Wp [Eremothecium sinecaudum]
MESSNEAQDKIQKVEDQSDRLQCEFFLEKKKRRCGMTRSSQFQYCSEHLYLVKKNENSLLPGKNRVPCPLDPLHTVLEERLRLHLKKCNKATKNIAKLAETLSMPWYAENINCLPEGQFLEAEIPNDLTQNVLVAIPVLEAIFQGEFGDELPVDIRSNEQVELQRFPQLLGNKKHAIQHSSLIQHLKSNGLWCSRERKIVYIEFGCGRAELSRYVNQSVVLSQLTLDASNPDESHPEEPVTIPEFILIDRGTNRMKFDKKFNEDISDFYASYRPAVESVNDKSTKITRKKIDIKDLRLDALASSDCAHVAISKHLCGVATDLTIRCLLKSENMVTSLEGMLIAMCCRHVCDHAQYTNPGYIQSLLIKYNAELTYPVFFASLKKIATWAVCGRRPGFSDSDIGNHYTGLSILRREQLGEQARRLIDEGRRKYLQDKGYNVELFRYCSSEVTLENIAMLVTKKQSA